MKKILIGTLCCFGLFESFVMGSTKADLKVAGSGGHINVKV